MQIYKKGQGNRARAAAALSAVAIAAFGIWEASRVFVSQGWFYFSTVVLVVFVAGLGLYLSLVHPKTSEVLIETQAEMKKVAWPPKQEVKGSTLVVIGTVIIFGLFLFAVDHALLWFTQLVRVFP